MALPKHLDLNHPDWKKAMVKFLDTPLSFPQMEFESLRTRNRTYHKSPGSRTYTESVYDDKTGKYEFHKGCEYLHTVEFWQEVAMLTGKDATVKEMQEKMVHLNREQVYEGYVHYCDVWSWDDDSPKTRNLMLAFEAEHKDGPGVRLSEKVLLSAYLHDTEEKVRQAFVVPYIILNPSA